MPEAVKYSDNFTIVSQNLGYSSAPKSIRPCAGGCIHDSNVWEYPDGQRFFIKFTESRAGKAMLQTEFFALEQITSTQTVRCPVPILSLEIPNEGFILVLEYLDLHRLDDHSGARLGVALAELHQCSAQTYGFACDNYIGSSLQINPSSDNWAEFFWKNRIYPQLELAQRKGVEFGGMHLIERAVRTLLASHHPTPSLLHGDLWGGNAAALADGTPVVFDPASYYGDRETDLAFTEVFGGFPPVFYHAYSENAAVDSGYLNRKAVYNLYHYLNHFNLFGSGYLGSCQQIIHTLLKSHGPRS